MNEWGVVGVLIALVGLFVTLIKPIVNLTKTITELTAVVQQLRTDMDGQRSDAHESHKRLWEHNDKQDVRIDDHEKRIVELEHK